MRPSTPDPRPYRTEPFPRMRRFALDAGHLGRRRHIIHGLIEVDVTEAMRFIRAHRERTGERLSFTAFVIACLGRAVEAHPAVHAYLDWRRRLVIFDDVHVSVMVESELDGRKIPAPHIFKNVNTRSFRDIHEEMRAVQAAPGRTTETRFMRWFLALPGFVRRLFYRIVMRVPHLFREHSSSVLLTAVGMFSGGGAWGIPTANFTLTLTLGGIGEKPWLVDGEVTPRHILNLTVSLDHDIIDGAPAARFIRDLKKRLEKGLRSEV